MCHNSCGVLRSSYKKQTRFPSLRTDKGTVFGVTNFQIKYGILHKSTLCQQFLGRKVNLISWNSSRLFCTVNYLSFLNSGVYLTDLVPLQLSTCTIGFSWRISTGTCLVQCDTVISLKVKFQIKSIRIF